MTDLLKHNVDNRETIIDNLKKEIIGPDIDTKYIQIIDENTTIENVNNNYLGYRFGGKLEEIFTDGLPSKKYAAGLLYPTKDTINQTDVYDNEEYEKELQVELKNKQYKENLNKDEEVENEESIPSNEIYKQSTMGITFAVPENTQNLFVRFECGQYKLTKNFNKNLQIMDGYNKEWWMRKSLESEICIPTSQKNNIEKYQVILKDKEHNLNKKLDVILHSNIRKINNKTKVVTLTIENKTKEVKENLDEQILFQSMLEITLGNENVFSPYPKPSELDINIGEEEKKFEFLYLDEENYSFGHDCSTQWKKNIKNEVYKIKSSFLPEYEVKTMTPDIIINNKELEIYHSELASAENINELSEILNPLIIGYEEWYKKQQKKNVNPYYNDVKEENLSYMKESINRIKGGLELLQNIEVFNTFKLVNLAMLMQMNNGKAQRKLIYNNKITFSNDINTNGFEDLKFDSFSELNYSIKEKFNNQEPAFSEKKWRGFQIAFLLQSIESIVNKNSIDREIVDLIWFPTGGGKTEAYLAVSAFSMIYRRMIDNEDIGVDTIMRYTLRLLTTDQFQRASRLLVSIDYIRRKFKGLLGENEFSIGLWVGSLNTPNKLDQAKKKYKDSIKGKDDGFVVSQCPWCGAEMKPVKDKGYAGYKVSDTLEIFCPDKQCEFHNHLPIYFIDEVLYKKPPTFLIGTIDKFVQLTWQPKARTLFGLNNKGNRIYSPPNLIVQDELHLISGPLGSLSGMYETLVEELTTDKKNQIKPKIICATATIKAYESQIKALFGREKSSLFPPSGFSINDNFYSKIKTDAKGIPLPGRKYVGIYTTTQGKLQSQVQVFSRLLTSVDNMDEEFKNPFWTILSFYNTINDIGKANTLADIDIPYEMSNYYKKRGIVNRRKLNNEKVKELTSRMKNNEVAKSLSDLKIDYKFKNNQAIDLVLASNIIEVGVDVDRLALMTIIGQPKTTAQYIQVSGRVGRKPDMSPGLVITIYNRGDSNDKSHYEHFNEFHQKLYANVEETSVTPFSHFSIERGFPAVLIGYLRQFFDEKTLGLRPDIEIIKQNYDEIKSFVFNNILRKMELVDNVESQKVKDLFKQILNDLFKFGFETWENTNTNYGYINRLNEQEEVEDEQRFIIFSMRNVDSVSKFRVQAVSNINNEFEFDF